MKYITKHETEQAFNNVKANLDKPNVAYTVDDNLVHYNPYIYNYAEDYLTFVALEDGTFQLSDNTVSYSLDNGETWTELAANTASPTVTAGNKIMWKSTLMSYSTGIGTFSATGSFNVQGNPMSLLYGNNFKEQTDLTGKNSAFYQLFKNNTKVVNAKNLSLPATTLADSCYNNMFYGCTNLTIAPELPAETLVKDCYRSMFNGCTSINYIKAMFTTTPSSTYTYNWVKNVSASGTFVKNSSASWDLTGDNGIPSGWTVLTASS